MQLSSSPVLTDQEQPLCCMTFNIVLASLRPDKKLSSATPSTYRVDRSTRGSDRHQTSRRSSILFAYIPPLLLPHVHNLCGQTGQCGTYRMGYLYQKKIVEVRLKELKKTNLKLFDSQKVVFLVACFLNRGLELYLGIYRWILRVKVYESEGKFNIWLC